MRLPTAFCTVVCMLALLVLLFSIASCYKDYSYEYRPADSTAPVVGSSPVTSACSTCNNAALPELSWRMTIDQTVYCGKTDKAVMAPDRAGFTFFGPSFCSVDSGFVVTIYMNNTQLTADRNDVTARMSCYYYDKIGASHVYISKATAPLQLTITRYDHQSGITTGIFRGTVVDANGMSKVVKEGRFHIQF